MINEADEEAEPLNPNPISNFTSYHWALFLGLSASDVVSTMIYSINAPLYPKEAESKNCTVTEYGLVLGSYEISMLIFCPIIGSFVHLLGSRVALQLSLILTGISSMLFGLLTFVDYHVWFLIGSSSLRSMQAIAYSIQAIVTTTIGIRAFPNSAATVFAAMELTYGVGMSSGPPIGVALHELGGFATPFLVLGATVLLLSIVTSGIFFTMSSHHIIIDDEVPEDTAPCVFLDLFKTGSIVLYCITHVVSALGYGFLSATLEPRIRTYKFNSSITGFIFLLGGGVYAFVAPIIGRICDYIRQPVFVSLAGSVLIFVGFLLLGPVSFIPSNSFYLLPIGLVIFEIGLGGVFVSSFVLLFNKARENGFPDNVRTCSIVSALWMSCVSLGSFIGPSVGGALVDNFGFRRATYFILVLECVVIILLVIHSCRRFITRTEQAFDKETAALLPSRRR